MQLPPLFVWAAMAVLPLGCAAQAPVWPVPGDPVAGGRDPADFIQPTASGEPESGLFGCVRSDGYRFHEAIDIAPVQPRRKGEATDPVVAIHDGVVAHINKVAGNSSYGCYVVLEHPGLDLALYTLYAHLARVEDGLAVGGSVAAGEPLGTMGRTAGGYSIPRERAHLHLEVGLRLSGNFEAWYRGRKYDSPNRHGNFNGMNLVSLDPLDYFTAFRSGRADSPLGYFEQLPPAVMLHVFNRQRPGFLDRYPELELPGCDPEARSGWEITLSAWGLPLSFKAVERVRLIGVTAPGQVSVVSIDRRALDAYACRKFVQEKGGKFLLGKGGEQVIELLFTPDRSGR